MLAVTLHPDFAAAQEKELKTEDLSRRAEVVAHGTVRETKAAWEGKRDRIVTYVTLNVSEYLKGSGGGTLTVVTPGGEVDGEGEWYSHSSRFKNNEEVILFAEKDKKGRLTVSGGGRGKVAVEHDNTSGAAFVRGSRLLEDFKKQIKAEVQSSRTN
jgi:hypothetical protein